MNAVTVVNRGSQEHMAALVLIDREQWLARRILKVLRVDALKGVTESGESRKERFRAVILERDAALMVAAQSAGRRAVLFGEAFEQLYGERL